jgi:hypothetical protein
VGLAAVPSTAAWAWLSHRWPRLLLAAVVILAAAAAAGVLRAGFPHVPPAARQPDLGTS